MSNALYDKGRQGFLDGSIDYDTNDIRVALVGTYAVNLNTHQFLSSVTNIIARSGALSGKTVVDGVADANDVTFAALAGAQVNYIVVYQYNVSDAAARLIAYIDTATGLPFTPNGGDLIIQWDNGANKIFKL